MNRLEELYKKNKEALDQLEPKSSSWEMIGQSLNNELSESRDQRGNQKNYKLFKFAAVIVTLLGLSAVILTMNKSEEAAISIALAEASKNESLVLPTGNPAHFDPSENKYTLVQFWSSGNALCIEENCYYYLPAYEAYKDKGFEIYAVSLDSDMAHWLAGIEENELPWRHVSDLKGWDSPICEECDITKVPMSYLLNEKGELLAKDLDASRLEETLAVLFAEI